MGKWIDLGSNVPYGETFDLQKDLLKMRQEDKIEDTFLLLEHEKVITIGNSGNEENVLFSKEFLESKGYSVHHINRGGDVTYHGPGQLVGYFIFNIYNYGSGVRDFFYNLEEIFVRHMKEYYDVEASREKEYPGVWIGSNKITALGCAIKKGVSMHGFGFNVNTDLSDFDVITPCGIVGRGVTSVEQVTGEKQNMEKVKENLIKSIEEVFNTHLQRESKERLMEEVEKWRKENQNG